MTVARAQLTRTTFSDHAACFASRSALVGTIALLSLLMMSPATYAQIAIGHVVDISGDWYLYPKGAESNEAQKLSRWQDVPPGGVIRVKSSSGDDSITIVDTRLNILVEKRCASPDACYQPIILPLGSKGSEISEEVESLLDRVWGLLWGEPYQSSLYRTRGTAPLLSEGVVPISNGEVDLGEIMGSTLKGKYSLLAYQGGPVEGRAPAIAFDWDPDVAKGIAMGDRLPGLYEISLVSLADRYLLAPDISIRVLICTSQDYAVKSGSFQHVLSLTEQWTDAVVPETRHAFLRAYLAELARTTSAPDRPLDHVLQ